MKCLAPGGNDAHLYYKEAEGTTPSIKLCKRMNINGWETFQVTGNSQITTIGEDTSFGSTSLTYFVDLSEAPSCWKNQIGTANGGISLGNYEVDEGVCLLNKRTTAYIGYNKPTFANINAFFSSNSGLEMIYLYTEGTERCCTKENNDLD